MFLPPENIEFMVAQFAENINFDVYVLFCRIQQFIFLCGHVSEK